MRPRSTAERALYFFGRPLVRCFYRVTARGLENLPAGGFLLVPNHISWVVALILQLACPRPIRYVIDQEYYHKPILHPILRTIGCIPISKRQSHAAVRAAAEKINEGEIVCVFPEGELERRGTLLRLQRGYEVIAAREGRGRSGVARSTMGFNLFIPGREIFQEIPEANPVPYYGGLWRTTRGKISRRRDRARGVAKAGRILFQPPAVFGSTSCRRRRARAEAESIRDGSRRWNRSHAAEPRKIARRSGSIQPLFAKRIS